MIIESLRFNFQASCDPVTFATPAGWLVVCVDFGNDELYLTPTDEVWVTRRE